MFRRLVDREYLGGDFKSIGERIDRGVDISLVGLTAPIKALFAASQPRHILYVTSDNIAAGQAYSALSALLDGVILFPDKYDYLTYKPLAHSEVTGKRINALLRMASGDFSVVVAPIDSLLHYLPAPDRLSAHCVTFTVDREIDYDNIAHALAMAGYRAVDTVDESGTFSMHGEVIDVYPVNSNLPYRIVLFDTLVESVKQFEPTSMMSFGGENTLVVPPVSDMIFTEEEVAVALSRVTAAAQKKPFLTRLQEISEDLNIRMSGRCVCEAAWWLVPFIRENLRDVASYLPADTLVIYDEAKLIRDRAELIANECAIRVRSLSESGEVLPEHAQQRPKHESLFEHLFAFLKLAMLPPITLNPIFAETESYSIRTSPIPKYYMDRDKLIGDLLNYTVTKYDVLMCAGDRRQAETIAENLRAESVPVRVVESEQDWGGIMISPLTIEQGFNIPSARMVVIGMRELAMRSASTARSAKAKAVFSAPAVGDYVVHEVHGIGKCIGIHPMTLAGRTRDYIEVQYRGTDKLYVPVDGMDRLSKYVAVGNKEPTLSSLGGRQFERTVQTVRESLKELSFNLLEVYAARNKLNGHKYHEDNSYQAEFEATFPHVETPDQLRAVEDIKNDLVGGKIMDRLICGDVGYGKTEVALRAIFKVVQEGKQCAVLVPTTLLAIQHFNLVKQRFADFGVSVDLMCRLRTAQEMKSTLIRLREGKLDVVIGTHRLLSKDVQFNDLGLLVLDEEQRFGVEHKEQIKALRHNINVLSLSATPIPRTLNMALNGIRDISILDTAPVDRLPVQTFVVEYSDALVTDAVRTELQRGGQVFILLNRVQKIDAYAAELMSMLPEARITVAHGQMEAQELERRMASFYSGETDVLVCTTIIENGIDLPDANTIIVCDADKLGLAELYQLRGRVGRSNRIAYAYFTVKSRLATSVNGEKRLNAIMENTELGSGFKIAMADLEIRGAGEILGAKQSGHIAKVGYDLYCKLLAEAVSILRGEQEKPMTDCEMQVEVDTFVDDDTADKLGGKLKLYKRIAGVTSRADITAMLEEYRTAVRRLPEGVENLMKIAHLKHLLGLIGAKKVVINTTYTSILFNDFSALQNEYLISAISRRSEICGLSVTREARLTFNGLRMSRGDKLDYLVEFAMESAQKYD